MNPRRRQLALFALVPAAAWSQPAAGVHRIGVLSGGFNPKESKSWQNFFDGMRKLGYEEGRNVVYEVRYSEGAPARFPQLAILVGDPVELGLAVSLARPGRNLTGSTLRIPGFTAKALELLIEALPNARRIGVLANPTQPNYADDRRDLERVAADKGVMLLPTSEARRPEEIESALDRVTKDKPQALVVLAHAMFILNRQRILDFAAQAKLPTMHPYTEDVEAGGLMSFAVETRSLYARAPVFVDKILRGTKAGDIPIEQPTRFGLWVNLTTARALGVTIPQAVLLRAERVIE
jgi:putative tryptophan/tyrosine transport system substrate-binding protein